MNGPCFVGGREESRQIILHVAGLANFAECLKGSLEDWRLE
jgi:hypothetical protein